MSCKTLKRLIRCSPDRLAIEDIDEAKALLEVADKYNMPWLVAAVKAYLMPGLGQLEVSGSN